MKYVNAWLLKNELELKLDIFKSPFQADSSTTTTKSIPYQKPLKPQRIFRHNEVTLYFMVNRNLILALYIFDHGSVLYHGYCGHSRTHIRGPLKTRKEVG